MQFNLKCSYIPVILMLAGCGGGGDGGTSSAPGGGSCDNASVQGSYAGGMKLLLNNTGDITGIRWGATVQGDNATFNSSDLASTLSGGGNYGTLPNSQTGILQSCRFDASYVCNGGDRVNMKLIFNPNGTVTGELNGQCGTAPMSGRAREWQGSFSGSRS